MTEPNRRSGASVVMPARVFRVRWKPTVGPYIAIGDVYEVGKVKKQRRVRERGGESGQDLKRWSATMRGALDAEVIRWANTFCVWNRKRLDEPFVLECAMCSLRRLRRKLERHGLLS
jgi:hypothetical protein